jgi:osmotically-inducible protein OsmY
MAQRQSERDTYSGERKWQQGAGVSSAAPESTVRRTEDFNAAPPSEPGHEYAAADRVEEGGVLRRLTDELGITQPGPKGYRRSDERIREDICERLWHAAHLDVGDVSVDVKDGVVHLEGTVPHRSMKHRIEDVAAGCRGVKDVENRVRVVSSELR